MTVAAQVHETSLRTGANGMRLRDSLWALIGRDRTEVSELALEKIRKAMLFALDSRCEETHYALDTKICFAKDVSELWYLRPELMNVLAASCGESQARDTLVEISSLFQGLVAGATPSRFGAL